MKAEHKPSGVYPVYCQTLPPRCLDDPVYLGTYPLNTPVRCNYCGRWSSARRNGIKTPNKTPQNAYESVKR
jgi:hypothetical protein